MPYITIRPRRGTASEWMEENPVLERGEFVIEVPSDGVGTGPSKFKIGDGVTDYNSLPYALDPDYVPETIDGRGAENFNIIQVKAAEVDTWRSENPVLKSREIGYDITNNTMKIGDGIHAWRNLRVIKCWDIIDAALDFGDEEWDLSTAEALVASNGHYKAKCLPDDWNDPIKNPDDEYNSTGGIDGVDTSGGSEESGEDTAGINDLLG